MAEAMQGDVIVGMVGVMATKDYLIVVLGLWGVDKPINFDPSATVTVESDAAPHMVLFAITNHPKY